MTGWTVDTLLVHMNQRFTDQQIALEAAKDAVSAALLAADKEADKTDLALKEYKTSANEWRATVSDVISRCPTRIEVDQQIALLESKIADLRESRSASQGHNVASKDLWGIVAGALGILIALAALLFNWLAP